MAFHPTGAEILRRCLILDEGHLPVLLAVLPGGVVGLRYLHDCSFSFSLL
jgi:hypothetical protein